MVTYPPLLMQTPDAELPGLRVERSSTAERRPRR
ncbi:MAG: hypothetical protein JWO98_2818 [Frankiales bacterium]|nr:hypothetical protein [Frankiales bacterium]